MTYTPGPWDIHEANDRNDAFYITHKNRRGIGSISNSFNDDGDQYTSAEDAANARLIAASPDLLAALKALVESIENLNFSVFDDDGATYDQIPWAQAEAAIDKATKEVGVCGDCGVSASDALGEYSPDEFFVCVECQWDDEHDTHDEQCKCKATKEVTA